MTLVALKRMIVATKIRSVSDPSTVLRVALSASKRDGKRVGVGPTRTK